MAQQSTVSPGVRWDGAFPLKTGGTMRGKDLDEIRAYIEAHRTTSAPFDLVMMGYTPGDDPIKAREIVAPYARAGLTWWLESLYGQRNALDAMRERIRQGPPKIE
jgi:hypothetical protein